MSQKEESAVFRVSCPVINYEKVVQQDILWNWKHTAETITPADSANARGFAYLELSSFVAGMNKITVGAKNSSSAEPFRGSISHVEIAPKLPAGTSDFWNSANLQAILSSGSSNRKEIE